MLAVYLTMLWVTNFLRQMNVWCKMNLERLQKEYLDICWKVWGKPQNIPRNNNNNNNSVLGKILTGTYRILVRRVIAGVSLLVLFFFTKFLKCSVHRKFCLEFEFSLPCLQQSITGSLPEPAEFNPYRRISILKKNFNMIYHNAYAFRVFSFLQVFRRVGIDAKRA